MNFKTNIARVYFYTKLGWGNYVTWWLGAIAYLTIIYEFILKDFMPPSIPLYAGLFFAVMVFSFVMGYEMTKLKIYSQEHAINTESNPYINIPIGEKEIVNYKTSIASLKAAIEFYNKQGIDTAELKELMHEQEELLKKAVK